MIKLAVILLLLAISGGFVINQIPSWKQRVIEVINPAAKEARLLGELKVNLDELGNDLNSSAVSASDRERQVNRNKDLVAKSQNLVNQITSANQKNSGIIKQGIGKIINAFSDQTPYPADHLQAPQTSTLSASCAPK